MDAKETESLWFNIVYYIDPLLSGDSANNEMFWATAH
jgi:hypothetical protein